MLDISPALQGCESGIDFMISISRYYCGNLDFLVSGEVGANGSPFLYFLFVDMGKKITKNSLNHTFKNLLGALIWFAMMGSY